MLLLSILIPVAAAVLPAAVLLVKIYKADKLEKEPPALIIKLILLGIVSAPLAALAERLGSAFLGAFLAESSVLYRLLFYFLVVALSEEGFKYLMLRLKTWKSPDFNCQFDGVVYAVTVSLGFALLENIGYVILYGLGAALVRAVTSVPGHACFGVFMGALYGMAKRFEQAGLGDDSRRCRFLAVLIPVLLHGCYDFFADLGGFFLLVFIAFVLLMFILVIRMVKKLSLNDKYLR